MFVVNKIANAIFLVLVSLLVGAVCAMGSVGTGVVTLMATDFLNLPRVLLGWGGTIGVVAQFLGGIVIALWIARAVPVKEAATFDGSMVAVFVGGISLVCAGIASAVIYRAAGPTAYALFLGAIGAGVLVFWTTMLYRHIWGT